MFRNEKICDVLKGEIFMHIKETIYDVYKGYNILFCIKRGQFYFIMGQYLMFIKGTLCYIYISGDARKN